MEGHNSIGGYDIFYTEVKGKKKLSDPVNVGVPINSVDDDIFYYLSADKKLAFFTSNRDGSVGRTDLFVVNYSDSSLKYQEIKGLATKQSKITDSIAITVHDINSLRNVYDSIANQYGEYSFNLDRGQNYFASVHADGYFFEAFTFSVLVDTVAEKKLKTVNLQKIIPGNVNKQYAVNFETDKTELDNQSEIFLITLADFIKKNPELNVDLSVKDTASSKISGKRIQKIIDYLKKLGISDENISTNMMESKLGENEVLVTVLDIQTKLIAFGQRVNGDIAGNESNANLQNQNPNQNQYNNNSQNNQTNTNYSDKLSSGNSFEKGIYTIQLGAFSEKKSLKDAYFKSLKIKPEEIKCNTGYWHYLFGKYKLKNEAENNLILLQKMGFTDAFVREISWYEKNKM